LASSVKQSQFLIALPESIINLLFIRDVTDDTSD
jgi:hypothetical protein